MSLAFFQKVYHHPDLSSSDLQSLMLAHERVQFSKNDIILNAGKVAHEYYIIESGLARSYVYDLNGNEITTDFAAAGQIVIEVNSLFQQVESMEYIQAITDVVAWKINFPDFQLLFHKIEAFREWGRSWMSAQLFITKQRSIDMITVSATDRYLRMTEVYPDVLKHAPLKHIATYLGITDTSLSRIRKSLLRS